VQWNPVQREVWIPACRYGRRGDLFKKRQRMMDDWAKFCGMATKSGNVVAINRGGAER